MDGDHSVHINGPDGCVNGCRLLSCDYFRNHKELCGYRWNVSPGSCAEGGGQTIAPGCDLKRYAAPNQINMLEMRMSLTDKNARQLWP